MAENTNTSPTSLESSTTPLLGWVSTFLCFLPIVLLNILTIMEVGKLATTGILGYLIFLVVPIMLANHCRKVSRDESRSSGYRMGMCAGMVFGSFAYTVSVVIVLALLGF